MVRRTYVRPMRGWWRRDPFFVRYMAREATAFCVAAYALVLLAGVVSLARGREPYETWLAWLSTPAALLLHGALFFAFVFHTVSWFRIMPKTMPPVVIAGRALGPRAITGAGVAAAIGASAALLLAVEVLAR
jgi:succinate dehydrogenase subunit C